MLDALILVVLILFIFLNGMLISVLGGVKDRLKTCETNIKECEQKIEEVRHIVAENENYTVSYFRTKPAISKKKEEE